ncbi:TetR/AcrR family transcriptional regulator [Aliamphritea ceti]|uniref:TetR/AcrR family transcriptional regulator n=1 Tax=Aliamphritea ceti TaxID=1524258 RepID=UPI0021C39441|nr:TetR/AcrR family transcriptional regulator [Aliamphritea ceti]
MSKIEQNREKKRRAILQAAQEVFLSEGYVIASMDKIAAGAQVTKQTVYRYYPSKGELFKATLQYMGENSELDFIFHLQASDVREAMYRFARGFIEFHLADEHLATYRLLVSESAKAPEMVASFMEVGPDDTSARLAEFFIERLGIAEPETAIRLWSGMLLSQRAGALLGMEKPDQAAMESLAESSTDFLLAGLGKSAI